MRESEQRHEEMKEKREREREKKPSQFLLAFRKLYFFSAGIMSSCEDWRRIMINVVLIAGNISLCSSELNLSLFSFTGEGLRVIT